MKVRFAGLGQSLLVPFFVIALAGGGAAAIVGSQGTNGADDATEVVASASASESPEPAEDNVARFHGDATSCPLPAGATLDGNWTMAIT